MHESNGTGIEEITSMTSYPGSPVVERRFQAITEHLFSMLSEEAVILSLKNGKYYGLNPVGVSIWHAIKEPATQDEIEAVIMQEYDVDRSTCQQAVAGLESHIVTQRCIVKFTGDDRKGFGSVFVDNDSAVGDEWHRIKQDVDLVA